MKRRFNTAGPWGLMTRGHRQLTSICSTMLLVGSSLVACSSQEAADDRASSASSSSGYGGAGGSGGAGAGWTARDDSGPGPTEQSPFYVPPSPLPAGAPGDVIRSEPIDGIDPSGRVRAIRVLYHSKARDGGDLAVSGVVLVPPGDAPAEGWPILGWAHGTTGVGDACAPSKWVDLFEYSDYLLALAGAGFVVAAADYEGLGTPGDHPYLDKEVEAQGVVDAVRAARRVVPATSSRWLAIGHSQGGQASLAVGESASTRAAELDYLGTVAIAPASSLSLLPALGATDERGYVAFLAAGIVAVEPDIRFEDLMGPEGVAQTSWLEKGCWYEVMDAYRHVEPAELRPTTRAGQGALTAYLERNEPAEQPLARPVLLVQGEDDDSVPAFVTQELKDKLCGRGEAVRLALYAGQGHDEVLVPSLDDTLGWIGARFRGEPEPGDCAP